MVIQQSILLNIHPDIFLNHFSDKGDEPQVYSNTNIILSIFKTLFYYIYFVEERLSAVSKTENFIRIIYVQELFQLNVFFFSSYKILRSTPSEDALKFFESLTHNPGLRMRVFTFSEVEFTTGTSEQYSFITII